MAEGVLNALKLFREIRAQRYPGEKSLVRVFVQPLRPARAPAATVRFETEPDDQAALSELLGAYTTQQFSRSLDGKTGAPTGNFRAKAVTRPYITPGQIAALPIGQGYVRVAGGHPVATVFPNVTCAGEEEPSTETEDDDGTPLVGREGAPGSAPSSPAAGAYEQKVATPPRQPAALAPGSAGDLELTSATGSEFGTAPLHPLPARFPPRRRPYSRGWGRPGAPMTTTSSEARERPRGGVATRDLPMTCAPGSPARRRGRSGGAGDGQRRVRVWLPAHERELLLDLDRDGVLTTAQVHRRHYPGRSRKTVLSRLARLTAARLVVRRVWGYDPQEGADQGGAGVEQVLAVVQDQQHRPRAQAVHQRLQRRAIRQLGAAHRRQGGAGHQGPVGQRRHLDQPHAGRVQRAARPAARRARGVPQPGGGLQGKVGLAGSPRRR